MAGSRQATSFPMDNAAVVDAKPLRTLTPMFPAALGLHTFTAKENSSSIVCVTPFGPYAGGTEQAMPASIPPMFASPAAPADPNQRQPYAVHLNGAAPANGTANNTVVIPDLQTPVAATAESGKKKRGRPKRVQDSSVPSAHVVPSVPSVNLVPSAPPRGNIAAVQMPPSTTEESGKKKRGRPKRVQDVPALSTPSAPQVDSTPVLQTPPASAVNESVTRKRGRPRRVQDSADTSASPIQSKYSEPVLQTPSAVTLPEDGKRKRGRPKRVPDGSLIPSSHSGLSIEDDSGDTTTGKRGRPRKIDVNLLNLPSLFSDDPRESVDNVLMMFDALRRRLMQLDEVKQGAKQQHNLKAGSIMMSAELRANKNKRIGEVPGVEVGDMFYFRIEMCLVGLNSQSMSGIDYMSAKFGHEEDPVAISIVSAGVYDNTEDDPDVLVYTGQGMSGKDDQKLERERSPDPL
ncbi:hypothetical protein E2562_008770 [Oryza meyeriana var. granulata]|uniref:YDG domain-containing protein n=1 Tax=Oryza meyeriana var. granulata TaxID=110450 RepID=A0A6G1CZX5_9ORYZ|nr:hypothetical protein E2562_008770 [Oryza meyeriana var. granulata]KAF0905691.1 hypothetical protein E2562_008770 [Oryza meyeriana var. granulata]